MMSPFFTSKFSSPALFWPEQSPFDQLSCQNTVLAEAGEAKGGKDRQAPSPPATHHLLCDTLSTVGCRWRCSLPTHLFSPSATKPFRHYPETIAHRIRDSRGRCDLPGIEQRPISRRTRVLGRLLVNVCQRTGNPYNLPGHFSCCLTDHGAKINVG